MMQKKTQGRKKTNMKKIDEHSSRQVTFSKRRSGLFNKASVLTGAEAAILLESPGGRVYGYCSPSVAELYRNIQEYLETSKELEAERKKKAALEKLKEEKHWWQKSIEGLGVEELTQHIAKMEKLRSIWAKELEMVRESSTTLDPSQNPSNDHDA